MSIDTSLINFSMQDHLVNQIIIPKDHFLIKLCETIRWNDLADIAIEDLYKDKKKWGRKLNLRLHLGAFILQTLFRWTDRELEENLNYYVPARIFCGITGDKKSHDHSSYTRFRGRLTDLTVRKFDICILKTAVKRGFTGTQFMDIDSTVQEANIEYPSDMRMMQSIFRKGMKVLEGLKDAGSRKASTFLEGYNVKEITKTFKSYFFAKKSSKGFELKKELFSKVHQVAQKIINGIKNVQSILKNYNLPWNYKKEVEQLTGVAPVLLKQIKYFIDNDEVAPHKILSLHAKEVKCICKGKAGKRNEFGRKFFVGRLPGNYTYTFTDEDYALEDAHSMEMALKEYKNIFNQVPDSLSGDQGFWSRDNLKSCGNIKEIGINPRGHKNWKINEDRIEEIKARRSKVEPLIGHLKKRGMGKSKMKSDIMTKLVGQRSSMSLNMARLIKDLKESEEKMRGDPSSLRSFGTRGRFAKRTSH